MFYSDTFPQIIQSLWLSREKMLSGFAIGHPGQRRVPLLVYKYTQNIYIMNTDVATFVPRVCTLNILIISVRQSSYSTRLSSYCLFYSSLHNCSTDTKL